MRPKTKLRHGAAAAAQDAASEDSAADKAQLRRAQVRKAQVQHRQRKANYVKQLEMDVARIREMIEAVERESQALLNENRAMRAHVEAAVNNKSRPLTLDQGVSLLKATPQPARLTSGMASSLQQDLDEVTVTLGFDEIMGAPTFYISSPPSPSPLPSDEDTAYDSDTACLPALTPAQSQAAINFILA